MGIHQHQLKGRVRIEPACDPSEGLRVIVRQEDRQAPANSLRSGQCQHCQNQSNGMAAHSVSCPGGHEGARR
jgi:hypothetical protein